MMKVLDKFNQKAKGQKVKLSIHGLLQKYVFMQMKTKLIMSFMVIILIPMIVFTIYSIVSSTDREKEQIKEKLNTTSIAANLMLDSKIKNLDTICINITNDNALKAPLQWAITSQLNDYCTKKKKEFSNIKNILVYGADGKAVTADTKDYDSIVEGIMKNKKGINGIYSNKGVNIISANLIYGSKADEILGAVVLVHNLNGDKAVFSSISKSTMTNVLFYDGKSLVFMADSKGQITEPKSKKDKLLKNETVLKNNKYYDNETRNFFGINYFVDYQAIKDINGKYAGALCVMKSDADLKKTLFNIFLVMSLIFVFSLIFTLAAAIFTSGKFTKPIGELMGLMKKVESGNLAVQSQSRSTDEIGRLSGSFNRMVVELRNICNTVIQRSSDISSISGEMDGISTTIVKDMDGIVITMNDVMNGVETDSACIQQTSANINEINDKAQFILNESKTAEDISKKAVLAAAQGREASDAAMVGIDVFTNKLHTTAQSIKELETTTQKIFKIIQAIVSLGNQTNLLALNASIEAARAGEAGKGFAVVADEVKKLSELTKMQVQNIKELTNEINQGTRKAVSEMDESLNQLMPEVQKVSYVGNLITSISDSINQVEETITRISNAASSEASATQELSRAVESIAGTTTATATASAETVQVVNDEFTKLKRLSTFVKDLNSMSVDFKEAINKFKIHD